MKTCICTTLGNELMDITVDSSYTMAFQKFHEVWSKQKTIALVTKFHSLHMKKVSIYDLNDPLLENHTELILQGKFEISKLYSF